MRERFGLDSRLHHHIRTHEGVPTTVILSRPDIPPLHLLLNIGVFDVRWGDLHVQLSPGASAIRVDTPHAVAEFGTLDDVRGSGVALTTTLKVTTIYGHDLG